MFDMSRGEQWRVEELMCRIALIDIKKTGGGAGSTVVEIMKAAHTRRSELVEQIKFIDPTHIAVAGRYAQAAFAAT